MTVLEYYAKRKPSDERTQKEDDTMKQLSENADDAIIYVSDEKWSG